MSNDERSTRLEKLDRLREAGVNPFHDRYETTHKLNEARELPDDASVRLTGRLMTKRSFGKLIFATLSDRDGSLQISLEKNTLSPEQFQVARKLLDHGDFIGLEGEMWTTKLGERTARVTNLQFLSKALRPLPEKWHGLQDTEIKYRQRYLDLISNVETRERFLLRSRVISFIRRYLDGQDFLEVETPILQAASSGAAARPFITHHNALGRDFVLRISPETYLKRLIVGGLERVYEIGKNFRNEGIDASHLQEFTMLEWYAAYWNYEDNMKLIQDLIQAVLMEFVGSTTITHEGTELDFGGDWQRVSFRDAVLEKTGIDLSVASDQAKLEAAIAETFPDMQTDEFKSYPALMDGLYKKCVRPHLTQPTFLLHHPTELVPLARRNDEDPGILDMFQVVVNSWEIVKAYSELVDPVDQRARMEEQQAYREQGDAETMMMEEDYILCMEHGMPPCSGLGLGIDRFVALLTGAETLRDVVYFPTLGKKDPKAPSDREAAETDPAEV